MSAVPGPGDGPAGPGPTGPAGPGPSGPAGPGPKLVARVAAVRRLAMGASLVLRQVEPFAAGWSRDRQALADRLQIAAERLRDAHAALDSALAMAQWIADCAIFDQADALRADLKTPARCDHKSCACPERHSGPAEPLQLVLGSGPTPGPAAAFSGAACGSDGVVVAPVAGASPGRGECVYPSPRPAFLPPIPTLRSFDVAGLGRGPVYDPLIGGRR